MNIWQTDPREEETHWDHTLMNTFLKQQNLVQMTANHRL